jgi:hypothetical protein
MPISDNADHDEELDEGERCARFGGLVKNHVGSTVVQSEV